MELLKDCPKELLEDLLKELQENTQKKNQMDIQKEFEALPEENLWRILRGKP